MPVGRLQTQHADIRLRFLSSHGSLQTGLAELPWEGLAIHLRRESFGPTERLYRVPLYCSAVGPEEAAFVKSRFKGFPGSQSLRFSPLCSAVAGAEEHRALQCCKTFDFLSVLLRVSRFLELVSSYCALPSGAHRVPTPLPKLQVHVYKLHPEFLQV